MPNVPLLLVQSHDYEYHVYYEAASSLLVWTGVQGLSAALV